MFAMSGFAAVLNLNAISVEAPEIQRIQEAIAYRGRDGSGVYTDSRATLIQSLKLVVANISIPKLPLTFGNCTIIGDVRLDGRATLIDRLRAAGQTVDSGALDETLVLSAYLAFGQPCLDHLIGDFSFAIWDDEARTLFAARDQIGRRSLYYAQSRDTILISNELRPLKQYPGVQQELDPVYIGDFLMLGEGFWIDKASTPFKAIRRLERGHSLLVQDGQVITRRYWSLPVDQPLLRYSRESEYIEHFRDVFREAVRDRLRADTAVITLSGGMDSSTVAATTFDLIRSGEASVQTTVMTSVYSGIKDPEEAFGRENAEFLRVSDRHVYYKTPRYFLLRPYVHIANAIRQNVTPRNWLDFQRFLAANGHVVLFGYLGDTLVSDLPLASFLRRMNPFAFVSAYRRIGQYFGRRPAFRSNIIARLQGKPTESRTSYPLPSWLDPDFVRQYVLQERWDAYWEWVGQIGKNGRNPYLFRILENYDYYTHDESDSVDFTPADSLDPFADLRVINFLASLPPLPWFHQKYLLRRAMTDLLPPAVLRRPKQILGDLTAHLLSLPENTWIDDWKPTQQLDGYVVRSAVPKITGKHARIGASQGVHLRPLTLDLWLNTERGTPDAVSPA